ncbi:MAG: tetratricopeptide repeat protein [Prevotella sp.]|nr:tetratricopeptide repeat protein [Prevotella sp.]
MKKTFCIMFISVVSVLMGFAQDDRQLIREGNKLYRSGQYAQAETKYRKALEKNAGNVRASYNLGCALMKQGKTEEADKQFSLVASSSQADKEFRSKNYYNKGVMHQNKKEYEKAIDAYKNALRLKPTDEHARKNLALCKRQLQKQQQQQQQQNQDQKNNQNQQDKKDKNDQQKEQQNNQNQQDKQQPEQKDEMSKENAEQLLNAAMQEEKATQQRLKKAMQQPSKRNLDKNW